MDVRIGVTNTVKEIDVELPADADRDEVKKQHRRRPRPTTTQVLWLTDKTRPRDRRAVGQDRLHRARRRRRRAPHRLRRGLAPHRTVAVAVSAGPRWPGRAEPARPPPAVRHRQGWRRQDEHRRRRWRCSRPSEGKRTLVCEVDAKGDLADFFEAGPLGFEPTRGGPRPVRPWPWTPRSRCKEYLKLQLKVPLLGRIGPLARTFDFVANAAPGVKEILTVGKLCYEVRERHYDLVVVDASATGHVVGQLAAPQAINELVKVGLVRDQTALDARHPRRPRHHRRGDRVDARGDAGHRDPRAGRPAARRDRRRPGRGGRQPGAARAVRPRRGGGLRPPARAPSRRAALLPSGRVGRRRSSRVLDAAAAGGHAAPHPRRAPRPACAPSCPPTCRCSTCPYLFTRAHGVRATRAVAEALGRRAGRTDGPPADAAAGRRPRRPARSSSCSPAKEIVITCGSGGVGKTTTAAAAGGHGRRPPRRQGARAHRRPGPAAGQRARPRAVRQRRDPGARRAVRRGRRRAPGRAVGGHARHQAVVGRPGAHPRPRRRDPRRHPGQPALPEHHRQVRPEPRLHRHGAALRDPLVGSLRPDRGRHAAHPQRPRLPRGARAHGRLLLAAGCCAGSSRPYRSRLVQRGLEALLLGRRPHPRLAVPAGHRRVLHPLPDDVRRLRRAGPGRDPHPGRPPHDVRRGDHARGGAGARGRVLHRRAAPTAGSTSAPRAQQGAARLPARPGGHRGGPPGGRRRRGRGRGRRRDWPAASWPTPTWWRGCCARWGRASSTTRWWPPARPSSAPSCRASPSWWPASPTSTTDIHDLAGLLRLGEQIWR